MEFDHFPISPSVSLSLSLVCPLFYAYNVLSLSQSSTFMFLSADTKRKVAPSLLVSVSNPVLSLIYQPLGCTTKLVHHYEICESNVSRRRRSSLSSLGYLSPPQFSNQAPHKPLDPLTTTASSYFCVYTLCAWGSSGCVS